MSAKHICECCGDDLVMQWSDTHGIGCCMTCGLPYRIYHYEGDKRVEKPPACTLTHEGIEIAKRYWGERHRRVFPACHDMGILSGRERSYSGATLDDCREFRVWYQTNVAAEPREPTATVEGR